MLWRILVPTVMDGKKISIGYHRAWDKKVRSITNGLTVFQPAKGTWVNDKEICCEKMIPVDIYCTEFQIHQIAHMTKEYYKQKKIMYHLVTNHVFFI